ncbi:hypothetical protein [Streptomyces sp. CRN 30]|uniref:hypothetical protein n=1 Tax=Streptomyces sp. CRN 30 TaxID=3075613 RepID=UPI002A7F6BF0|nr:hypothetical protein [Streptomyces sp. CRN 30]
MLSTVTVYSPWWTGQVMPCSSGTGSPGARSRRDATGRAFFGYRMPDDGDPANNAGTIVLNPAGRQ